MQKNEKSIELSIASASTLAYSLVSTCWAKAWWP